MTMTKNKENPVRLKRRVLPTMWCSECNKNQEVSEEVVDSEGWGSDIYQYVCMVCNDIVAECFADDDLKSRQVKKVRRVKVQPVEDPYIPGVRKILRKMFPDPGF
jgi:hypothetical protein